MERRASKKSEDVVVILETLLKRDPTGTPRRPTGGYSNQDAFMSWWSETLEMRGNNEAVIGADSDGVPNPKQPRAKCSGRLYARPSP